MNVTEAWVSPGIAVALVGAAGTAMPGGVTGALGSESGPVPKAFVALTVKVYAVPFVRPPMTTKVGGKGDPGLAGTTAREEIAAPPTNVVTV